MIAAYFSLTKPRMVFGNVLVAAAAFIFASPTTISWPAFFSMSGGLWLVVSSACVINNYYDRDIDARMERTQARILTLENVGKKFALVWAAILLLAGILLLLFISPLALGAALFGWVVYALLYTPLKHKTGFALYVGAIAGAMPPVVGYVAAAGRFDFVAGILFALLYLWQLPHFTAIALYRFNEYRAAGVPLLVRQPQSEQIRMRARTTFYLSLIVLALFCAGLIAHRWIR